MSGSGNFSNHVRLNALNGFPVVILSNGSEIQVTDARITGQLSGDGDAIGGDITQQFESLLQANSWDEKAWQVFRAGDFRGYSHLVNDTFFRELSQIMSIDDIDQRNIALCQMRNWVNTLDFSDNPAARDIYLNVIDKTGDIPFSNEMEPSEIREILWEAWNRPEGVSYLDTNISPSAFGSNNDQLAALRLAWNGWDGYIKLAENATVEIESAQEQPLGNDINQRGYGSCQMMAAIDNLVRQEGGREYLESLITKNDDGTYNVQLYNQFGQKFYIPVTLGEEVYETNFDKSGWSWAEGTEGKNVEAPEMVQVLEIAYMKAVAHYVNADKEGDDHVFNPAMPELLSSLIAPTLYTHTVDSPDLDDLAKLGQNGYVGFISFDIPQNDGKSITINGFAIAENHAYSVQVVGDHIEIRNPWDTQKVMHLSLDEFTALNPSMHIAYSPALKEALSAHNDVQQTANLTLEYTEASLDESAIPASGGTSPVHPTRHLLS